MDFQELSLPVEIHRSVRSDPIPLDAPSVLASLRASDVPSFEPPSTWTRAIRSLGNFRSRASSAALTTFPIVLLSLRERIPTSRSTFPTLMSCLRKSSDKKLSSLTCLSIIRSVLHSSGSHDPRGLNTRVQIFRSRNQ